MRAGAVLTASCILTVSLGAEAADKRHFRLDTGGDLVALCDSAPEHPNHAAAIHMCQGFLVGLNQMHRAVARALDGGIYCLPETLPSRNAVAADFVGWMDGRDDLAAREAVDAALTYAAETYPCSGATQ